MFSLAPGPDVSRRLAGGQLHVYEIDLPADTYLHATFEQRGVDLTVDVFAPGRRKLFRIDNLNRDRGPEEVHLVSEVSGRYRFELTTDNAVGGEYRSRFGAVGRPQLIDRQRAAAERAFFEARAIDDRADRIWEATAKYERALLLDREVGDRWGEACALLRLGRLAQRDGRLREARDLFDPSERLFEGLGERHLGSVLLNLSGTCSRELADFAPAASSYQRALTMARESGEEDLQALSLKNLGLVHQLQGRLWQALDSFRQAVNLWRRQSGPDARSGAADALTCMGWVYSSTGDWPRALDAHWQALRLRNRLGDPRERAISLTQIGNVWLESDAGRAIPYLERARDLLQAGKNPGDQAAALNGLGRAFRQLGRYAEARAQYQQALALYSHPADPAAQAITWNNLGSTELYRNAPAAALQSFANGLRLARQMHNPIVEARSLQGLAAAELARGDRTRAQGLAEEALQIVERLRATAARPDLQTSYLAANQNAYGLLIRILMQRHRQQPGGGFDLQALRRCEQSRARTLRDALRESRDLRSDLRSKVPAELLSRRRAALEEASAQDLRRRSPAASASEVAAAQQAVTAALDRLSEIDAEIRRHRRESSIDPSHDSAGEEPWRRLDRDSLLLEYFLASPHSYLWAASAEGVQSFELPASEDLEPLLQSAYRWLSGQSGEPRPDLLALSRILLGPIADQLRGKRLLIAADGGEQVLPFVALPNPGGRHAPLIEDSEIVYVPSLAVLEELRGRASERPTPPRSLAALADPVFDASDRRLWPAGPLRRDGDAQDVFLPRLLRSRDEVQAILALLPAGRGFSALDFDASRDLVTSGRLSRYGILHFATHALQRTDYPELSALVLSRFDRQGAPRDGYLRVPDIAALDLPADLVTLSACDTALGRQTAGEGLVGLPQAFLAAGAHRVLVSLWKVEDESTAALMARFYRHLLIDRLPPGQALRQAQLAIRAQSRWSSPRYWAGFVLQGDWQ